MNTLTKLIGASLPLSNTQADQYEQLFNRVPNTIQKLYLLSNGLIAFEGSLVVYPIKKGHPVDLFFINEPKLWKNLYPEAIKNTLFFARDIFGGQYGYFQEEIYKLNPETGELKKHSKNIESWANIILLDYDYETGWSLARNWQLEEKTRIKENECLIPKRPFSIGGDFETDNLEKYSLINAMKKYGNLYQQIKNISTGEKISIHW